MRNKWGAPKTIATLTATANDGHAERRVILWKGDLGFGVRIDGTPGSWYLSTLTSDKGNVVSDAISIDFGQGWSATGMKAVITEALDLILSGKVS